MNPFDSLRHFGGTGIAWLVVALMILTMAVVRRRPITAGFGLAVILLLVSAACGGGGVAGTPSGTPAGSYQVTVTGTSGSVTSSTTVTLLVN
jgi:apolipoprotein N-acyltransferase